MSTNCPGLMNVANVDVLCLRGVDTCSQTGFTTPLSTQVARLPVYQGGRAQ
jgi:hypothetical protein